MSESGPIILPERVPPAVVAVTRADADLSTAISVGMPPWVVAILEERVRQLDEFGVQSYVDGTGGTPWLAIASMARKRVEDARLRGDQPPWMDILLEELYEAFAESNLDRLQTELVQTGAVIGAWLEDIQRRKEQARAQVPGEAGDDGQRDGNG